METRHFSSYPLPLGENIRINENPIFKAVITIQKVTREAENKPLIGIITTFVLLAVKQPLILFK
jgi:hypothetical protein